MEGTKQRFDEYKVDLIMHGYTNLHIANEPTRILIGSLVHQLKNCHLMDRCPIEITSKTVFVRLGRAFLGADSCDYTVDAARENYKDLANFLEKDVFDGRPQSPSFSHFLTLLRGHDSIKKEDLILRHYTILSSASQISFINNLFVFPGTWDYSERESVYTIIDKVTVPDGWDRFMSGHPFFEYMLTHHDATYEISCPINRTSALTRFFRNCYSHLKDYNKLQRKKHEGASKKHKGAIEYNPSSLDPAYNQDELARSIQSLFPMMLTEIQTKLHDGKFLKRFCINPVDQYA